LTGNGLPLRQQFSDVTGGKLGNSHIIIRGRRDVAQVGQQPLDLVTQDARFWSLAFEFQVLI